MHHWLLQKKVYRQNFKTNFFQRKSKCQAFPAKLIFSTKWKFKFCTFSVIITKGTFGVTPLPATGWFVLWKMHVLFAHLISFVHYYLICRKTWFAEFASFPTFAGPTKACLRADQVFLTWLAAWSVTNNNQGTSQSWSIACKSRWKEAVWNFFWMIM